MVISVSVDSIYYIIQIKYFQITQNLDNGSVEGNFLPHIFLGPFFALLRILFADLSSLLLTAGSCVSFKPNPATAHHLLYYQYLAF